MNKFEQERADREAKSDRRFRKVMDRMDQVAKDYIHNRISHDDLFKEFQKSDITKTALLVWITARELPSRQLPKGVK